MNILELKNLNLSVNGKQILDDLSLDIWEGHIHAIVGPNGAGKSTLAYVIMGLDGYRKHSGDIIFRNQKLNDLSITQRAKKGITLAWQEPARFVGLTTGEYLSSALEKKDEKIIRENLELVGLEPDEYISRAVDHTLSGGERKKIELASVLTLNPDLLLLDEPDSGIDFESLKKIFEIIKLLKERGTTVILITHSLEVLRQAEHAFLICSGNLIDKGVADKIIGYYENNCLPCDHKNKPPGEQGDGNDR